MPAYPGRPNFPPPPISWVCFASHPLIFCPSPFSSFWFLLPFCSVSDSLSLHLLPSPFCLFLSFSRKFKFPSVPSASCKHPSLPITLN